MCNANNRTNDLIPLISQINIPFCTEFCVIGLWDKTVGWWWAGCWYAGGNPGRKSPFPFGKNGEWNSGGGLKAGGGGWWRRKSLLLCECRSTWGVDGCGAGDDWLWATWAAGVDGGGGVVCFCVVGVDCCVGVCDCDWLLEDSLAAFITDA